MFGKSRPPGRLLFLPKTSYTGYAWKEIFVAVVEMSTHLKSNILGVNLSQSPQRSVFIGTMQKKYAPLATYSSIGIGGRGLVYEFTSEEELLHQIPLLQKHGERIVVLGGGTNILFTDEITDTIFLKPTISFIVQNGFHLSVGAGIDMADLLNFTVHRGLSGLEWAGGLPGTVGGAVRGNAGAFGGEIQDNIETVRSVAIASFPPCIRERSKKECRFAYRSSVFKERAAQNEIITEVTFRLQKGDVHTIRAVIKEKKQYRSDRHPLDYPNIGSIFKNVPLQHIAIRHRRALAQHIKTEPFPVIPAAVLIQRSGCIGMQEGGALVSPKHANFIINNGGARSRDVQKLIHRVRRTVFNAYGIRLQKEIVVL